MADQPGKSPIGIIKGPAPKTPPQTQTVVKTSDQLLREAHFREGYAKGLHEKGMKNFWHGAAAAVIMMVIGACLTFFAKAAWRETGMIDDRVAIVGAISNAKLLNESKVLEGEGKEAPVVEPEGQK